MPIRISDKLYINGIILTQDDEGRQVSQLATRGKKNPRRWE